MFKTAITNDIKPYRSLHITTKEVISHVFELCLICSFVVFRLQSHEDCLAQGFAASRYVRMRQVINVT